MPGLMEALMKRILPDPRDQVFQKHIQQGEVPGDAWRSIYGELPTDITLPPERGPNAPAPQRREGLLNILMRGNAMLKKPLPNTTPSGN